MIKKHGTNFIDIDFPPNQNAVSSKGEAFDRIVHWRRPREFMEADAAKGLMEPQIFEKDIEPGDIL
jgi:hypothetical protein